MTEKLLVPDIGDFENVEVIEILVKEGQEIEKNDPVVTIESDKSSVEVPSIFSGKVDSINVKVGDKVSKGDLLINITNKEKISDLTKEVPKNTENLIKEAEKALELEPNNSEIIDHLGDIYYKIGRNKEAIFEWKRALIGNADDKLKKDIKSKLNKYTQ